MTMTTFVCPGCKQTVEAELKPEGKYPYPPHYVCPDCDKDDEPGTALVVAKPIESPPAEPTVADEPVKEPEEELPPTEYHRRTQRQLALLQEDDNPSPE